MDKADSYPLFSHNAVGSLLKVVDSPRIYNLPSSKMSTEQETVSVRGGYNTTDRVTDMLNHIGNFEILHENVAGTSHREWNAIEESVNLRKESERLKTFKNWPVNFLESKKLASAGFYYLRQDDKVRCVFCGIELGNWRPGDEPMKDHARWSGGCPFVNKEPVGNIPLENDDDDHSSGFDTCGPFSLQIQSCGDSTALPEDPKLLESPNFLKTRPPSFPDFATIDARLRSYDTWPISLKLKPKVLSEAGFFYTGKGDQTICYHCGGGLKDWEETDEPWVEHARWFSKCPFVLTLKGKAFVEEVCGKKAEEDLKSAHLNGLSLSSSTGDLEKIQTFTPGVESQKSINERNDEESSAESSSSGIGSRSSSRGSSDVLLCKICYTEEVGAVFLPCGHMMACIKCALSLSTCAVCRKPVTAFFRAFVS